MILHPQDLFLLKEVLWPDVWFYDKQVEVIESALVNRETHVPAGNMLGKDFLAGFLALGCFKLCEVKDITCRIVTTSVAEPHLNVLWGEIGRFFTAARQPLDLVMNHLEVRRASEMLAVGSNVGSYLKGLVAESEQKMQGHHAGFTLFIGDEASGLHDKYHSAAQGWAKHMLYIGNPNDCANFFRKGCEGGDLKAEDELSDDEEPVVVIR